jgi:hypothetical protein
MEKTGVFAVGSSISTEESGRILSVLTIQWIWIRDGGYQEYSQADNMCINNFGARFFCLPTFAPAAL